ncbi:hypothetical protein SDC9_151467 [bioreactor metagenome]|uniref:Uncharacterized protein n=1 Tax=bioreactor metagenome TaxID=1076179 RepID=A0A645EQD5_9ZZZZ
MGTQPPVLFSIQNFQMGILNEDITRLLIFSFQNNRVIARVFDFQSRVSADGAIANRTGCR